MDATLILFLISGMWVLSGSSRSLSHSKDMRACEVRKMGNCKQTLCWPCSELLTCRVYVTTRLKAVGPHSEMVKETLKLICSSQY